MINRELIRIKVVQMAYAYSQNEGKTIEAAEKEFLFSLGRTDELYKTLLALMVGLGHIATRTVEMQNSRAKRLAEPPCSTKFIHNRFLVQLRNNHQMRNFIDNNNLWADHEEFLRHTYARITEMESYQAYMESPSSSYYEDQEIWRKIYRQLLCNNDELDEILEDVSLYWNDDKVIVDSFVLKTIHQFDEAQGPDFQLLPEFRDDADREFATTLFRTALSNRETYSQLIQERVRNWDIERLAAMDLVIMQVGLAELLSFPSIPVAVTLNEYVEIAKAYSTPQSGAYINGILDSMVRHLRKQGLLDKE